MFNRNNTHTSSIQSSHTDPVLHALALLQGVSEEALTQLAVLNQRLKDTPRSEKHHMKTICYPEAIRVIIEALQHADHPAAQLQTQLQGHLIASRVRANLQILRDNHAHFPDESESALLSKWLTVATACVNPTAIQEPLLEKLVANARNRHANAPVLYSQQIQIQLNHQRIQSYYDECDAFKQQLRAKMRHLIALNYSKIMLHHSRTLFTALGEPEREQIIDSFLARETSTATAPLAQFYERNPAFQVITDQYRIVHLAQAELKPNLPGDVTDKMRAFNRIMKDPANRTTLQRSPEGTEFLNQIKRAISSLTCGLFFREVGREHHEWLFTRNRKALKHNQETLSYKASEAPSLPTNTRSIWGH